MNDKYILDKNHELVPIDNLRAWASWFENRSNRIVARTSINGLCVSTVFLSIDHGFGDGPPILFETMIFREEHLESSYSDFLDYQERYSTWDEALKGHREAVAMVEKGELV